MHKIQVLSDIHLVPEGRRIIGIDPVERVRLALDHCARVHPDLDRILFLGDLAHHGAPEEYARLRDLLADQRVPVTYLLGNHDRREAFRAVFPQAPVDPAGFVQSVTELGRWRLIALDTLDGPPYGARNHAGRLCPARLDWLRRQLEAGRDRPTLLALHHPVAPTGFPAMDAYALRDPGRLLAILDDHPQVRHLLIGHIHRTISGSVRGHSYTVFKSTAHQMPMDLVGDDEHASTREPGAYGLVLLGAEVVVHTEDFEIAQSSAGRDDG
ncbi:MAG: phosphodiesterase [Maritimibacter sp.]|nr:phosphodiesterase [Maritimibacter sp.]